MKVSNITPQITPKNHVPFRKCEEKVGAEVLHETSVAENPIQENFIVDNSLKSMEEAYNYIENRRILNNLLEQDLESEAGIVKDIKKGFIKEFAHKVGTSKKPIMIAITGESASGKSTFTEVVQNYAKKNNSPITFFKTDSYFRDISDKIKEQGSFGNLMKSGFDLDNPNNFYLDELKENLMDLKKGRHTKGRKYLLNGTGVSMKDAIHYSPNKIIFVEGTTAMLDGIGELFDAKIYIEADEEVRKNRLIERARERGEDLDEALFHWNYVKEAGRKFVQPLKEKCDVVLSGEFDTEYVEYLTHSMSFMHFNEENNPKNY
ncbi:hypothetical protein IKA92_02810 [bacterium]|nr:hypothetical protein [bacterium]